MWAKASQLLLLIAAALGGCAMEAPEPNQYKFAPARIARQREAAILEEAVALAAELRFEPAAEKFQQVLDRSLPAGDRQHACEAMFWLGYCREKQGRRTEAVELYQRVISDFAGSRAAALAQQRLSQLQARK